MATKEYLSFDDLNALDSSPVQVKDSFKKMYRTDPDGIALNKETYFKAVKPAITEQYGHYAYKTAGQYQFTSGSVTEKGDAIVGSSTVRNESDTMSSMTVNVQGEWNDTTSYSTSSTTGLTFSNEITIEGFFKTGTEFSFSVTSEKSESKSVRKTSSTSVTVDVPPRSKVTVTMTGILTIEKMEFKVPIDVSGMFGANFPKRVKDHYFWFRDVHSVLPKTSGEISGVIENTNVLKVDTVITKAVPI
ncbi:hydralysin-like [Anneissia japonica]|uniref:hydralysin-like n=1 Tax=Anneissia japonica TaxID=1529436 RepID=UPI001425B3D8|nr:hydralysin-like [Anneissia japonica]